MATRAPKEAGWRLILKEKYDLAKDVAMLQARVRDLENRLVSR
jgi:hypothetical protein